MVVVFSTTVSSYLCLTIITALLLKSANSQDLSTSLLNSHCSEKSYEQKSEFQDNLRYLLYNLTLNSNTRKFYNFTVGENPSKLYGLYLCYNAIDNQLCQNCIETAVDGIQQTCRSSVEAIVWYTYCMLRYANHSIIAINDESIYKNFTYGPQDYSQYRQQLSNSFYSLFEVATAQCISSRSASTTGFIGGKITLNSVVECTPDLSTSDCHSCLETALARIPTDYQLGFLMQPSCRLLYFYDIASLLLSTLPDPRKKSYIGIGAISALAAVFLIIIAILICCLKKRKARRKPNGLEEIESMESLQIEFDAIKTATYNFSEANKLGKGGFGIVYMGTLADGQAVAVKRLSNASGQGIREFKTEACLAAKLQHKNLVKVYGFRLEGTEMLLVYEFVPNKSLDRFLFDAKRGAYLKWETRYKIIMGIARGLLYLHEDSRPKIVHRDLKPSNILLDGEMNPKIADFGMAKLFGGEQTQGNTTRIAGTFGYMAPEYAGSGHFSVKSDVFSFGVLILEIISGRKNRSLDPNAQGENLLRYAWRLKNEGVPINLVDAALGNKYSRDEVDRCIQVALLCIQEDPSKRPNMDSVLIMLNTQLNNKIPPPTSPPAFSLKIETPADSHGSCGIKMEDFSELSPR